MSNINIWVRPKLIDKGKVDRNKEIVKLVYSGASLAEVGRMYDLSRTRVEQIVTEYERMARMRKNFDRDELLSDRSIRILVYDGIVNTEQILALSEQEILRLRGAGFAVQSEISEYQKALGGADK